MHHGLTRQALVAEAHGFERRPMRRTATVSAVTTAKHTAVTAPAEVAVDASIIPPSCVFCARALLPCRRGRAGRRRSLSHTYRLGSQLSPAEVESIVVATSQSLLYLSVGGRCIASSTTQPMKMARPTALKRKSLCLLFIPISPVVHYYWR